jgi:hypothetical protein
VRIEFIMRKVPHLARAPRNGGTKAKCRAAILEKSDREILDSIGIKCNVNTQEDWYKVTQRTLLNNGGRKVLKKYNFAVLEMLKNTYPEFCWYPWKQSLVPSHFWWKETNRKAFCDWIADELGVTVQEDWYRITQQDIDERGGWTLLHKTGTGRMVELLSSVYPQFEWNMDLMQHQSPHWESIKV